MSAIVSGLEQVFLWALLMVVAVHGGTQRVASADGRFVTVITLSSYDHNLLGLVVKMSPLLWYPEQIVRQTWVQTIS